MNGAGAAFQVSNLSAHGVGQADFCIGLLPFTRLTPQVPDDLGYLGNAGGADGVALGQEASARIHRRLPAYVGRTLIDESPSFPRGAESELFVVGERHGDRSLRCWV